MRSHKRLDVWKKAMQLVKGIYRITAKFPDEEKYGLTSQMRRSAVSVPSNIAEGAARSGKKEFLRFLYIARGSLSELETQILIAIELTYITEEKDITDDIETVFALLSGLIKSVNARG